MLDRARTYIKDHPTEALVAIGTLALGVVGAFCAGDRIGKLSHERTCEANNLTDFMAGRLIDSAVDKGETKIKNARTGEGYLLSAKKL
jgi:hypothetical protein